MREDRGSGKCDFTLRYLDADGIKECRHTPVTTGNGKTVIYGSICSLKTKIVVS
jgi:hypothetical protein